jgi:predicted enzyme related to lactoylglutathione lyase
MQVTKVDFVAVPVEDMERAARFYGETLGLRRDAHSNSEFWAGETCISLWKPEWAGREFMPQRNGHLALHVDDVAASRAELEGKGVEFRGEIIDTSVCHMALFTDSEGNDLMLHRRYAPYAAPE